LPNRAGIDYTGATLVASHRSAPVKDLVRHVLQKSDNNYAAQLLALSGKHSGKTGDWRGGLEALQELLRKHGFDSRQMHFRDGTGLSRYNWVSPRQVVRLLDLAWDHRHADLWRASLVGAPGSESRLERYGSGWKGRLLVKTGTLEGVASLAGYLKGDSGKWMAFAVMANNYDGRSSAQPGLRTDPQAAFGPFLKRLAKQY
jgi:D-alanyl-D-alanine carboxypeptidase/D-alanyl-D-alanine-endopeptidase (penicillin-binding protein 4)